jgi:hypothetical protein
MSKAFRTLALLGKANSDDVNQTISALYDFLTAQHYKVLVESRLSRQLSCPKPIVWMSLNWENRPIWP